MASRAFAFKRDAKEFRATCPPLRKGVNRTGKKDLAPMGYMIQISLSLSLNLALLKIIPVCL